MRKASSPKHPHDPERLEQDHDDAAPMRRRTGEEDEAEVADEHRESDLDDEPADDARDHSLERLGEDDLANMQGPDA